MTRGTESLDDSIFLIEFRAGFGNGLGAIPAGIGNGGKLHRLTSMSIAVHFLLSLFHQNNLDFVDDLIDTFHLGNSFLGKLLVVEAGHLAS